jgi:hypothetical protein
MKATKSFMIIFSLIASVLANDAIDLYINQTYKGVMTELGSKLNEQNFRTAQLAHQRQQKSLGSNADSTEELFQLSKNLSFPVISQYEPIAYKIIHDAGYNTRGNYYIFDSRSKQWHLPNMPAPSNPINGTEINSKILSTELDNAFKQLVSNEAPARGIQKRFFRGQTVFFHGQSIKQYLKSLKVLAPEAAEKSLQSMDDFMRKSRLVTAADNIRFNKFSKENAEQLLRRQHASDDLKEIFRKADEVDDLFLKKKILKEAKKTTKLNLQDLNKIDQELIAIKTFLKEDYGRLVSWGLSTFAAKSLK